jgi:hypothetical protein
MKYATEMASGGMMYTHTQCFMTISSGIQIILRGCAVGTTDERDLLSMVWRWHNTQGMDKTMEKLSCHH